MNWFFTPFFNQVWFYMVVSFHSWRNTLFLAVNQQPSVSNYLSWDSNPSGEGRVVSKRDVLTTRPLLFSYRNRQTDRPIETDRQITKKSKTTWICIYNNFANIRGHMKQQISLYTWTAIVRQIRVKAVIDNRLSNYSCID